MEKSKNFFANKKVGYYLVIANVLLAIFVGIFFFATYKHFEPGYMHQGMASNAYGHVPEVIGLFLFLAAILELVALLLPEYLWVHLLAIVPMCISLMKQIYCIPNLVADEINKIHYQGGSLPLCLSWLIITIVIIAAAIAVLFIGMIKQEDEDQQKKEKIAGKRLVKVAVGGGVAVAALAVILSVYGVTAENIRKGNAANKQTTLAERVALRLKDYESKKIEYDFNPAEFKLSETDNPYSTAQKSDVNSAIPNYATNQERQDADGNPIHKIYVFEGLTAEGWQGNYTPKTSNITLWEDGLYNGVNYDGSKKIDDLKGYWYNVDEAGADCLVLISTSNDYNMVGNKITGDSSYYEWFVDVHANYNTQQGGRYIKANGVKYTPLIGMFVDTGSNKMPQYTVNGIFEMSEWTCLQVRNNLAVGSIFDSQRKVEWAYRAKDAAEDAEWSKNPDMSKAGVQVARARWNVEKFDGNTLGDHDKNEYYYEAMVEFEVVEAAE